MRSCVTVGVVWGLSAIPAAADWWAVHRASSQLDLATARRTALETVASAPTGADAVAAAGWWLDHVNNLPDPEEILTAAGEVRDPELGFLLARVEGVADGRPPAGTLDRAELAGPFGVFSNLDLERGVVPPDEDLPPSGTPYRSPWKPVRYGLKSLDGYVTPPSMLPSQGVFVVLWDFRTDRPIDGWMAVEADGSFNLLVDGRPVERRRFCGRTDSRVVWLRTRLETGVHRVRAELAGGNRSRIRVSLYDDHGRPVKTAAVDDEGLPWAGSSVEVREPPAMASHLEAVATAPSVSGLLLAAAVSELREDPVRRRRFIEQAAELDPDDPWPGFAAAWYWLTAATMDDSEAVRRRVRDELRGVEGIPLARLLERALAMRERRQEDQERILEFLVENHGDDVRIIRMWIREALERGWVREAEDGLRRLQAALPGSRDVAMLELEVLEALERWRQRERLLSALAESGPAGLVLVDELAEGCLVGEAVSVVERLRSRAETPDLDVEYVRLLFSAGRLDAAAAELVELQNRWGFLRVADELALTLTAGDPDANRRVLADVLERNPSAMELLSLAWRRGERPFYEDYRLTMDDVRAMMDRPAEGVDAVLVLDQAVERVFPDGSSLYYYHGVTRALTPVGAQQAAQLQQLPGSHRLKVRVHKPDGTIVVPSGLGRDNGHSIDEVGPGDFVEEEYLTRVAATGASRRGHLPPYIYRFADSERAFGLSEYLLLVPPEIELSVEGNFQGVERTEWTDDDGLRAIRWRAESVPPVPEERFAPPTSELLPWVSYGFGVTWADVGDAVRDRLLPLLVMTPELDRWSGELPADDDPATALTRLVGGLVDEVEPGRRTLDFSTSAGASFSRREGNRLGIIAAVLLDAGWRVDLVMARTRPFKGTHLLVPTFDAFFMPLLRLERDGSVIWLDIDQERQGVDHIDPMIQGSDGLVVPLDRPSEPPTILAELPSFENPDLEERMRVVAEVDANGDGRLSLSLPIRGPQAQRVLEQIRSVPTERVPMVYQQMAASFLPSAMDVSGSLERVDGGVVMEMSMRAPAVCRPDGDEMVCRDLVFTRPLAPVLAALPTRSFDLIMPVPVLQLKELVIQAPPGWTVDGGPRKIETQWGSVIESLDRDGRRLESTLRLELPAQTVAPEDYPRFARFCHAVDELTSRPPRLSRTTYTPEP